MTELYTNLESNVVCAMTDKYPTEFESDEDRSYWLDIARRAISEVMDHVTHKLAEVH